MMSIGLTAQEKNETLIVKGNCGMCKSRIENAVKELPSAQGTWDAVTQTLKVQFDVSKTNLDEIAKSIAKVGHDNALYQADEKVYKSLHGCCQYDREESAGKQK